MARLTEFKLKYFPLDCTFFTNDKVKALRRAHGTVGIATYLYILCNVYDNGYYYRVKDIKQFAYDVAEGIANEQLGKVAARVLESIDYMADDVGLLDRSCLDIGILTSRSIQEQYSATIAKFKRKAQIKEYSLLGSLIPMPEKTFNSEEKTFNSEEKLINSEFMQGKRKGKRNISLTRDKPPTLADIQVYCKERSNHVDAQRFFDYYTANGWLIGGQPMQDWQAAVRRWESNGYDDCSHSATRISSEELNDLFIQFNED